MSDFSLHTLGVIYLREHKFLEFLTFVSEDIIASGIHVLALAPDDFSKITDAAGRFHLDFDDAYLYAVAERYDLSIISFDKDFDRTKERKSDAGGTVPESSVIRRFFCFFDTFLRICQCAINLDRCSNLLHELRVAPGTMNSLFRHAQLKE